MEHDVGLRCRNARAAGYPRPAVPVCNGSQLDAFTESVDVSPTILDWLAGDVPVAMNGVSLLPWLEGDAPSGWRDYAYAEMELGDPESNAHCQRELGLSMREANFAVIQEDRHRVRPFQRRPAAAAV